ncbi:unnamed protein product, partial [Porites lobata]
MIYRSCKAPLVLGIYKEAHLAISFNMAFVCLIHVRISLRLCLDRHQWTSLLCRLGSLAVPLYILPLSVIAVSSAIITRKLKDQKIPFCAFHHTTREANFKKRNRYIMRLLLAIVILFAVCWLPVHLLHFLIFFYEEIYLALPQSVPLFLFWVSHANSALDPCVVILLNGSFRKTLMDLIRSLSCRLRFKSNRVNCVSYELFQPFDTRLRHQ